MTGSHFATESDGGLNLLLRVLANGTRRHLLRRWMRGDDTVSTVEELSAALEADEDWDGSVGDVKTVLYHNHLPVFADAGVVAVDWEQESVRYQSGHPIETLFERVTVQSETPRS